VRQLIRPIGRAYHGPVAKRDLPPNLEREELSFAELVATLKLIEGESVTVRLTSRELHRGPAAGLASIVGELRYLVTERYDKHEISIGDPYAEDFPEKLAGGIVFLSEASFEGAAFGTFDGNDYFWISIITLSLEILIGDVDSTPA
jgi:hypothetical protein